MQLWSDLKYTSIRRCISLVVLTPCYGTRENRFCHEWVMAAGVSGCKDNAGYRAVTSFSNSPTPSHSQQDEPERLTSCNGPAVSSSRY